MPLRPLVPAIAVAVALASLVVSLAFARAPVVLAADCQFVFGFRTMHDRLPDVVGDCAENEHGTADGTGSEQTTTRGVLTWSRATNVVTFRGGDQTWTLDGAGSLRRGGGRGAGQSILAERRLVSYYGNPLAAQLGILGELSKAEVVRQVKQRAAEYERLDGRPTQGAIELIAVVAQASPGADGLYRLRMADELIQEYVDLAEENDLQLILDLQPGYSSMRAELDAMRRFLVNPRVHVALDPEFELRPPRRPGLQLGSTDADSINDVIGEVARIVEANKLPNKIVIVHQFTESMIGRKGQIQDSPLVDIVIDMDGFGGRGAKVAHYDAYVRDQPVEFAGIKLFLRHDVELLDPATVMSLNPPPDIVIYQ